MEPGTCQLVKSLKMQFIDVGCSGDRVQLSQLGQKAAFDDLGRETLIIYLCIFKNWYKQVPFTMYIHVPSRIFPISSTSPCRCRSPWVPMVGSSGGCPGVLNVVVQWSEH